MLVFKKNAVEQTKWCEEIRLYMDNLIFSGNLLKSGEKHEEKKTDQENR